MKKIYGVRTPNFGCGAFDVWVFFQSFTTARYCYPAKKIYRLPAQFVRGYINS